MDIPLLYKLVRDARAHFSQKDMLGAEKDYVKLIGFGHVGDGVRIARTEKQNRQNT
jgi:hypothetical protein